MQAPERPGTRQEAIAVVGMDCIFPGARDLAAYWRNIVRGIDATCEVPPSRWQADDFDFAAVRGGFIDGLTEFSPLTFGVMPASVEEGDPEQFLVLSVIHRALLDVQRGRDHRKAASGRREAIAPLGPPVDARALDGSSETGLWAGDSPERTEVVIGRGGYLGNATELGHLRMEVVAQITELLARISSGLPKETVGEIRRLLLEALRPVNSEVTASSIPNLTSGRVCNRLGFMGSNYTVDAACASALVAIDNVMASLREHRCDLGIAAGVHLVQKPHFWNAFETLNALSRSGRLCAFGAEADGLLIGEGIGAVVLKRLSDAERDGDGIYATIRGAGVASDGRGAGLMTPRVEGEVLALRRAYGSAGIDPQSITLIEGHGTGTPVGDATEITALHEVFGRDGHPAVALGSVKSMIGHTMAAAGMAGFMKAVLALYHRVLPPTLHAERSHPGLDASRIYANTVTRPWIASPETPRRAGVNAFGFGGINCHVIVEEYPENTSGAMLTPQSSELFLVSADTRSRLLERLADWAAAIPTFDDEELQNVAFTESLRFSHEHAVRMAIVVTSITDLQTKLARVRNRLQDEPSEAWSDVSGIYFNAAACPGKVAFLFPGIGFPGLAGGYTERLAELCMQFSEVRQHIDFANGVTSTDAVPYSLGYQLFPPPILGASARVSIEKELAWSERTPTGMMTANLATWSLLRSMGFQPDAIAGFSLGEWAALVAAEVLDVEELPKFRKILNEEAGPHGGVPEGTWAMVAAGADQVEAILHRIPGVVTLTMDVSPTQVFIGGETQAVHAALKRLREIGLWGQELPFPPIHTPLTGPLIERLKSVHAALSVRAPVRPVYCGMNGRPYPEDPVRIRDMIFESLASPVRIRDTIRELYLDGVRIFVQLGSGGKILTNVQNTLALHPHVGLSIDLEHRGGLEQLHHLVGHLAALGVPCAPAALFRHRLCRRVDPAGGGRSKRGEHILPLSPPRLHPPEGAISRLREILVPTSLPHTSGDIPPPPTSDGAFEGAIGTLTRFLEVQQQAETHEARLLMEYLALQEAVLANALAPAGVAAPGTISLTPGAVPDGPATGDRQVHLPTIPDPPSAYPLVGEIVHRSPGQELQSRMVLDLNEHLFLRDHTFIRVPASLRPIEELLPTVPLTVGVEMLAEAAAALLPDLTVLSCHDVEATRWITLQDSRTLGIDIVARRVSDTEVSVELHPEGQKGAALRGMVTLGLACPRPPDPMILSYTQPCPHTAEQLYGEGRMFHGPRFQVVTALREMAQEAVSADLILRDPQELFATPLVTQPIFDPVLLDGVGQVVGYRAELDDWAVYPVRIGRVTRHAAAPPPGTTVRAAIRYRRADARRVVADIDVFDATGALWLHVEGWGTWRLMWPKELQEFAMQPQARSLAAPWPAGDARPRCFRMTHARLGEMNLEWIARTYLAGEDWVRYRTRPDPGWLFGRIAVVDAIRDWVRCKGGPLLHPLEVKVANLPNGAPMIVAPAGISAAVSLAHIEEEGIALVADAKGVGVDIVRVAERSPEFRDLGFDEEERAIIAAASGDERSMMHRAWSAKEAAAKAHGLGFDALPRFRVRRILVEDGTIEVEPSPHQAPLRVKTTVDRDRVIAVAVID